MIGHEKNAGELLSPLDELGISTVNQERVADVCAHRVPWNDAEVVGEPLCVQTRAVEAR